MDNKFVEYFSDFFSDINSEQDHTNILVTQLFVITNN